MRQSNRYQLEHDKLTHATPQNGRTMHSACVTIRFSATSLLLPTRMTGTGLLRMRLHSDSEQIVTGNHYYARYSKVTTRNALVDLLHPLGQRTEARAVRQVKHLVQASGTHTMINPLNTDTGAHWHAPRALRYQHDGFSVADVAVALAADITGAWGVPQLQPQRLVVDGRVLHDFLWSSSTTANIDCIACLQAAA